MIRTLSHQLFDQLIVQFNSQYYCNQLSCNDIAPIMSHIRNCCANAPDSEIYIDKIKYTLVGNEPYFMIPLAKNMDTHCTYWLIHRQGGYWNMCGLTYSNYVNGVFVNDPYAKEF